ncbi:MAG: prepilin-type N-terminal cleavage/methylation domain-containing protein [bacterium]|nr:prepilin-type N-terminal cleavage/methylation domain-containing protein [bacterium]
MRARRVDDRHPAGNGFKRFAMNRLLHARRVTGSGPRAFTLIELLIVVAIIGILAAIAVPNFINAQVRAKMAKATADMRSLGTAVEMYALDNGAYPCDGQEPGCLWDWNWQNFRLTTPVAYMSSIPKDPYAEMTASGHYWYTTREGYGGARANGRSASVKGRVNVRLYDPPRQNYKFAFISTGPDRMWEWDRPAVSEQIVSYAGDVLYYDASNGAVSQGDLYMYGPGNTYNPPADFK